MTLLAQSTQFCKPLPHLGTRTPRQSVVSVRASKRSQAAATSQSGLLQKAAAAAAAAAILLAPAAFAGTPKPPTLGDSQSSYAESLTNAIKERGSELKELAPSGEGELKTDKKPKPFDQPFTNELGAGNSAKDAGPIFSLGEGEQAPSKPLEVPSQIQEAVPDFFQSKPSPSPAPAASSAAADSGKALAAKQTAVDLPDPPSLPSPPSLPNPADAAKNVAGKLPSPATATSLPAKVPPYPAKAAKAGKETSAKSNSPDPKEAAAANQGKLLIGGVLVAGSALWFNIEKKADPSRGGLVGGGSSASAPSSSSSPPPSSGNGGPDKEKDPFFQNVEKRTK